MGAHRITGGGDSSAVVGTAAAQKSNAGLCDSYGLVCCAADRRLGVGRGRWLPTRALTSAGRIADSRRLAAERDCAGPLLDDRSIRESRVWYGAAIRHANGRGLR